MKVIQIIVISFIIAFIIPQNIFAIGDTLDTGKDWIDTGKQHKGSTMDTLKLAENSKKIYNIFLTIAVSVALIVGAILGISYMLSGTDKKTDVKQSLLPFLISCIVVFGSFGIWKLVVEVVSGIN